MSHRSRVIRPPPSSSENNSSESASTKINALDLDEFDADCYFKNDLKETLTGGFQTLSIIDRNLLLGTLDPNDEKKASMTGSAVRRRPNS